MKLRANVDSILQWLLFQSIPQKFAAISLPSIFNEGLPCLQVQHNLPINQGTFPVAFAGVLLTSKAVQVAISLSDGTILIGNLSAYNEGMSFPLFLMPSVSILLFQIHRLGTLYDRVVV